MIRWAVFPALAVASSTGHALFDSKGGKPGPYLRRTGTDDTTVLVGIEVGWTL